MQRAEHGSKADSSFAAACCMNIFISGNVLLRGGCRGAKSSSRVARAEIMTGGAWCSYISANLERLVPGCIKVDLCAQIFMFSMYGDLQDLHLCVFWRKEPTLKMKYFCTAQVSTFSNNSPNIFNFLIEKYSGRQQNLQCFTSF